MLESIAFITNLDPEILVHEFLCLLPGSAGVDVSGADQSGLQIYEQSSLKKKSLHTKSLPSQLFSILCLLTIFCYFFTLEFQKCSSALLNEEDILS